MKFLFLFLSAIIFMASCRHKTHSVKPAQTQATPVQDFRGKYTGKFVVEIHERYFIPYTLRDTTYTCTITVVSKPADTVIYGNAMGNYKYPSVSLVKEDGSDFCFFSGTLNNKEVLGIDSSGKLLMGLGAYDRNKGGFTDANNIDYEYKYDHPKPYRLLRITGARK